MIRRTFMAVATAALLSAPLPLSAEGVSIEIRDAYARASTPTSKSGAAFMMIVNTGAEDDRLIGATSPAAKKVELHTHKETGDGVMKMVEVEEGFPISADGMHALARGGDHVMFMGLTAPFEQGAVIPVTLTFEKAGEIEIEVPVDLERKPGGHGHHQGHGMGGQG